MDSCLTYDGAPATSITGLGHLEGETVSILADGAVLPDQVVASGAVTLTTAASVVQVGLPYTSNAFTLRNAAGGAASTTLIKRIDEVTLRLHESSGGLVGPDASSLDPMVFRAGGGLMDTSVPLFTGDFEVPWDAEYGTLAQVYVRQYQPLPMTIEAIVARIYVDEVNPRSESA